jgi:hypothetical protein
MAGQLVGRILRSPHAHARIKSIDTSKAEALKGVKAVITSADLPDLTGGKGDLFDILDNCMARTKALYDGHAVAAVAAPSMPRPPTRRCALIDGRLRDPAACDRRRRGDEAEARRCCTPNCFTEHVDPRPTRGCRTSPAARPSSATATSRPGFADADIVLERTLQDRAVAPGLHRAACLRRQGWVTTARPRCGSAPRDIS